MHGGRYILLLSCSVAHLCGVGSVDTRSGAFAHDLATMQSRVNDMPSNVPVITLNGEEILQFDFDILRPDRDYMRYTLVHCDANWQPSQLSASEYVDGFNEWTIDDYAFSQSTAMPYTHYRIIVDSQDKKPRISGNYLLQIYHEGEPDDVLAQYRFIVTEQTARIEADATTNTDVDFNKSHQQLSAIVDVEQSGVRDPFNDLILKVSQNGRHDNEATITRPLKLLNSTTVVYDHLPELVFEAGNEYRRFETVSNYNPTMGVEQVRYHEPYYHYCLYLDQPRSDDMYLYDQTLHGGYVVRSENAADNDQDAEYGIVHFTLEYPKAAGDEYEIFLDGDFASRRLDETSRMVYNDYTGLYERSMLLKQGAYSYQYLCVQKGGYAASASCIEGNHYQTNNQYRLVVYAHNPLDRYDRVICVAELRLN